MWIRMISTAAGPRLPHALLSEKVYQVEDELAQELIDARAAAPAADPNPPKAQPGAEVEVAAVDDGEKALEPGTEKKAKSLIEKLKPASAESVHSARGSAPSAPAAKSEAAKK
jgi:hypothetical protein